MEKLFVFISLIHWNSFFSSIYHSPMTVFVIIYVVVICKIKIIRLFRIDLQYKYIIAKLDIFNACKVSILIKQTNY